MRKPQPVTVPGNVVEQLWSEIKNARDEASQAANSAHYREERLNLLLKQMKSAGMDAHLPTLEEVQAAWRGADEE